MEREAAYAGLADWFEYLNDDCGYENWSQYLIAKLGAFPLRSGLDIGCGGGWFTRAFHRADYAMTGLDISPEMLNFAMRRSRQEGAEYPIFARRYSKVQDAGKIRFCYCRQ